MPSSKRLSCVACCSSSTALGGKVEADAVEALARGDRLTSTCIGAWAACGDDSKHVVVDVIYRRCAGFTRHQLGEQTHGKLQSFSPVSHKEKVAASFERVGHPSLYRLGWWAAWCGFFCRIFHREIDLDARTPILPLQPNDGWATWVRVPLVIKNGDVYKLGLLSFVQLF